VRTNSDRKREENDTERVVGYCGLCGGEVVDGKEFIQPNCRRCGATPKRNLPTIEMERPKRPAPTLTPAPAGGGAE
jgi:hypothetical protein